MEMADLIQKFFLLLLPGMIGMSLYYQLNIHEKLHYYFEFLKLIGISVASYLLSDCVFFVCGILIPWFPRPANILAELSESPVNLPAPNVFAAVFASLVIACVMTKANYEGYLFRIANRLNLTSRFDNRDVWEHLFEYGNAVVLRDMVTENIFYGKVLVASDNSEKREILMSEVDVYNQEYEWLYHADLLYLSRDHNQFTAEIQNANPEMVNAEGR